LLLWKVVKGVLEDRTALCHSQQLCHLSYVDRVCLEFILGGDTSYKAIINFNSMRVETIGLLELGIHEVEDEGMIFGAVLEESFEHGPCSLDPGWSSSMASDKLVDVCQPNLMQTRPLEVGKSELEGSECLFEVGVFPEEICVIDQHQGSQASVLSASFKGRLYCLKVPEVDLEIDVKLP